jgi:hypothetical protein
MGVFVYVDNILPSFSLVVTVPLPCFNIFWCLDGIGWGLANGEG